MSVKLSEKFSFRKLKADDIPQVAELCAECFEGPFGLLNFYQKGAAENRFKEQLGGRYRDLVVPGFKHTMLVVADAKDGEIVAFLESGMLPPPPVQRAAASTSASSSEPVDEITREHSKSNVAQAIGEAMREIEVSSKEEEGVEVPYLGNVAVKEAERRQGIGSYLVQLSIKLAARAGEEVLYVIVDANNLSALKMYVFCSTVLLSFLVCDVSLSLLSIYCSLPAFSDTTWHESNHHLPPPLLQSIINRHNTHTTYHNTGTARWVSASV
jgi:ribosomal protein S18 acetylase RimI-like enzyme